MNTSETPSKHVKPDDSDFGTMNFDMWGEDSSTPTVAVPRAKSTEEIVDAADKWLDSLLFTTPLKRAEFFWNELRLYLPSLGDFSEHEVEIYLVTKHKMLDIDVQRMQMTPDKIAKLLEADVLAFKSPATADDHALAPAKTPADEQHPSDVPKVYLLSWREILNVLNLKNDKTSQGRVRNAHKSFPGPIIMPNPGGQPKVLKADLLIWWNGLEDRFREDATKRDSLLVDRSATVENQFDRGRGEHTETVVPEIGGRVKGRRGSA